MSVISITISSDHKQNIFNAITFIVAAADCESIISQMTAIFVKSIDNDNDDDNGNCAKDVASTCHVNIECRNDAANINDDNNIDSDDSDINDNFNDNDNVNFDIL